MSDGPNEWTFCTEHLTGAVNGECVACRGDRNLVQVVRRYYLDVARAQVETLEVRCAELATALRKVASGAVCTPNCTAHLTALHALGEHVEASSTETKSGP